MSHPIFERTGMGSVQPPNQCDIAVPIATPAKAAATPIERLALLVSGNQTDVDERPGRPTAAC
jgi:hypothetical protein